MSNLNQDGVLDAGIHRMSLQDFKNEFINNFPSSKTRGTIFQAFENWCKNTISKYHTFEIWLDGSYVTSKINPNDIDCVLFFYADGYIPAAHNWQHINTCPEVDGYFTMAICDENEKIVPQKEYYQFINNRNYWRGQFGFDRNDHPKGIVSLDPDQFII